MYFLDTNIFIRFFTNDDPQKAKKCLELFEKIERKESLATTTEAVITEIVYILSSKNLYNLYYDKIKDLLEPIFHLSNLKIPEKQIYLDALEICVKKPKLDFEDAIIIAKMRKNNIKKLYSYDKDFDKIPGVERIEP